MYHKHTLHPTLSKHLAATPLLIFFISAIMFSGIQAQTVLAPGDLAFLELQTDDPDRFSFFTLVDLDPVTEIRFTDAGWSDSQGKLNENEDGVITWMGPSMGMNAGTIVTIEIDSLGFVSANVGWAMNQHFYDPGSYTTDFDLSIDGDQVIAYQATDLWRPASGFIAAISSASTKWGSICCTSGGQPDSTTSDLPPGLTDGVHAISYGSGTGYSDEYDNIQFLSTKCSLLNGLASSVLTIVHDEAYWSGSDIPITAFNTLGGTCDSFNIVTSDTIPPVITCPTTGILYAGSSCSSTLGDWTGFAAVSDNLDPNPTVIQSPSSSTIISSPTTMVSLIAFDANGNDDTCSFIVSLVDTVPPVAVCQDITLFLPSSGTAVISASDIDLGSSDNCGTVQPWITDSLFDCSQTGANLVTLHVSDGNGNSSSCSATVTVLDTITPVAVCQDLTVFLDGSGHAQIFSSDIDAGSSDNCGAVQTSISDTAFDCSDVGPNSVTLTVTDGSGNSATCTGTVTVVDTIPPTAVCQDVTVYLPSNGQAIIIGNDIDLGSSDNCGSVLTSVSDTAFDCSDIGANFVTLSVTDGSGNSATCSATVTVEDTVPPVAVCQDITLFLPSNGTTVISASDIDLGSSDNCGTVQPWITDSLFDCSQTGANLVTLHVSDGNGNSSSCSATVTVLDTITPVAVCQDLTVFLDGSGHAQIFSSDIDGGSNDNCGAVQTSISDTAFDCSDVGPNSVTLTVTDGSGNSATCTGTVTVVDTIPPTAVCQDVTVYLDETGKAQISNVDIDAGSSDNCGSVSLSLSDTTFDCSNIGGNTTTLTVTDGSGNSSTCSATVTVLDTFPLTISCPGIQTLARTTNCAGILPDYSPLIEVNGNCTPVTTLQLPAPGTEVFGPIVVNIKVSDPAGSMDSCNFPVVLTGVGRTILSTQKNTCFPSEVGSDTLFFTTQSGCDSLVISNWVLRPGDTVTVDTYTTDSAKVGTDSVLLSNRFGCDSLVITETLLDTTVSSINGQALGGFVLSPNPAQDEVILRTHTTTLSQGYKVRLTDLRGRLVLQQSLDPQQSFWQIPLSHLPEGMYWVYLQREDGAYRVWKLLVQP